MVLLVLGYAVWWLALRRRLGPVSAGRIDALLLRMEGVAGIPLFSLALAAGMLLLCGLHVRPAFHGSYQGVHFSALASSPLHRTETNPDAFRILTPLISWGLGLRGERVIITNWIFACSLLALVYARFRGLVLRPVDALFAAVVLALSSVTLLTVFNGGLCDSATYLVVFLMWGLVRRTALFHVLFFVGLLNHESIAFLVPWFLVLKARDARSDARSAPRAVLTSALGFSLALGAYWLCRRWIASQGPEVSLTSGYYLSSIFIDPFGCFKQSFHVQGVGMFGVFRLTWAVIAYSAWKSWQEGERWRVGEYLLILGGAWAQLFVAFDASRMFTLAFMLMPLALEHLSRSATDRQRALAWQLAGWSLLVPPLQAAAGRVEVMRSPLATVLRRWMGQ